MEEEPTYAANRMAMVEKQLISRNIYDKRVLETMSSVPRHLFIPPEHRAFAYADGPLPIGNNQTISQPYIVALMTQILELQGNEKVLEVGAGSGYQAAVLSLMVQQVHTIERHPELAQRAAQVLRELGYANVTVHTGDGSLGLADHAPFDAIIVTAAAPQVPSALLDQLTPNGRLVIPVGSTGAQHLELWTRKEGEMDHEAILPVAFVPLIGAYGWQDRN